MAQKKAKKTSSKSSDGGKPGKRQPYVSRFKKESSGFGANTSADGDRSGYRGPEGPVGIQRPRGANRGS